MAAVLSVIVLGDESVGEMGDVQKTVSSLRLKQNGKRNLKPGPLTLFGTLTRQTGKPSGDSDPLCAWHYRYAFRGHAGYWSEKILTVQSMKSVSVTG